MVLEDVGKVVFGFYKIFSCLDIIPCLCADLLSGLSIYIPLLGQLK